MMVAKNAFIAILYTPKKAVLAIILMALGLLMSACSTVSVTEQSKSKAISNQRGNIVSDNKLSRNTAATLLSAGLNEQACFQHFDLCLDQLADSMLDDNYRPELAIFAELHYAKARQLANSDDCQAVLIRPPIDPYYANAPLSAKQQQTRQETTLACINNYQHRLFDAIKSSYAYLFYDSLTHDFEGGSGDNKDIIINNHIASDIDIQTQDIYHAASSDVITQLYKTANQASPLISDTTIEYLPAVVSVADSTQAAITNNVALRGQATDQIKVMKVHMNHYNLEVYLPNENSYLQNAREQTSALSDLTSTYELRLNGLNSISKRPGLGVSFVASLNDRYTTTVRQLLAASLSGRLTQDNMASADGQLHTANQMSARIYPTGHLLLTGLIKPEGQGVIEVLASSNLDIHLYNPYRSESTTILDKKYPLAANFSAGYGMWLAENQLDGVGYLNLITRKSQASLPKLFMLEPYDPNKRVLIMLHGLASSPAAWVNLTNDILNDQTLRDNYQVWQVFYPTNLPILENRYQIQQLIEATYKQTDPRGQNRASQNSVIISHSMGGIIARMMLSDDNLIKELDRLNDAGALTASEKRKINEVLKLSFGEERLEKRFELQALSQVDTAVFLSTPFRGTDYADRWFTRALRRIIYLPVGLVKTVTDNLATLAIQGDLANNPLGALYLQNGASQLSNTSSFIKLTKNISINDRITYHSIIASNDADITKGLAQMQPNGAKIDLSQAQQSDRNDQSTMTTRAPLVAAVTVEGDISQAITERLSDGIVPYTSAHLDGAASETIINGGHSIQQNPQTILTLRRILYDQLQ